MTTWIVCCPLWHRAPDELESAARRMRHDVAGRPIRRLLHLAGNPAVGRLLLPARARFELAEITSPPRSTMRRSAPGYSLIDTRCDDERVAA